MPILTERERVGTKLADKYELSAILGSGGMGTVYTAVHTWTGRRVAVKVLKPSYAENEDVVRRFLREARAAAALHHPNVVDVLDMGRTDDGAVYMVLELLEGDSLGALIRRDGKMEPARALPILVPMAEALSEVHARGFVHRDLKPDNIFVASLRGKTIPKLLDFGIAKALDDTDASTRTGAIMGTAYYMSPEQAGGRPDVGPASDIWALGVVLYETLTGEPPFTAESATGVLVKIITTQPPQVPPEVPSALARIVERAMRHSPSDRYSDMREMMSVMRDAAQSLGIALPDPVAVEIRTPEEIERASFEPSDPRAAAARAATVPSDGVIAPSFLKTLPREAPRKDGPVSSGASEAAITAPPSAARSTSPATWIVGALATAVILVLAYLAFVRTPASSTEAVLAPASPVPVPTPAAPTVGTTPTTPVAATTPTAPTTPAVPSGATPPEPSPDVEPTTAPAEHHGGSTGARRTDHPTSSPPPSGGTESTSMTTTSSQPDEEEPVHVRDEW